MATRMKEMARVAAVGLVMMFGALAITPAAAQDVVDPAAVEEDDSGFDDWGLLGLLGLGGLAGLLKRPEHEVRTVDRGTEPRR